MTSLPDSLAERLGMPPLDLGEWELRYGNPWIVSLVVEKFLAGMARVIDDLDEVI